MNNSRNKFLLLSVSFRGSYSFRLHEKVSFSSRETCQRHIWTLPNSKYFHSYLFPTLFPRSRGRLIKTWLDLAWLIATGNFLIFLQLILPNSQPPLWFGLLLTDEHATSLHFRHTRFGWNLLALRSYHYSSSNDFLSFKGWKGLSLSLSHDIHVGQTNISSRPVKIYSARIHPFRLNYTYHYDNNSRHYFSRIFRGFLI